MKPIATYEQSAEQPSDIPAPASPPPMPSTVFPSSQASSDWRMPSPHLRHAPPDGGHVQPGSVVAQSDAHPSLPMVFPSSQSSAPAVTAPSPQDDPQPFTVACWQSTSQVNAEPPEIESCVHGLPSSQEH